MHIVWRQVGTQHSIWVNNLLVASGTSSSTAINTAATHRIGANSVGGYFDGYLADVNFVDGGNLTPSSFGEINATTGVWTPKRFTGAYGNNGFYLKFTDASAATATTIGKDFSGRGNNWTPSGISVTAGTSYDSMYDTPLTNYSTLNFLTPSKLISTLNGCLLAKDTRPTGLSGDYALGNFEATAGLSIKWYFEATFSQSGTVSTLYFPGVGWSAQNTVSTTQVYYYRSDGQKNINGTISAYGSSYTSNDVIGVALDQSAGTLTFYKNGVSQGVAATGLTQSLYPLFYLLHEQAKSWVTQYDCNFGQYPFVYTPPAGHVGLSYANLPTPAAVNGASVMAATAYTGTGSALTVTNTNNGVSFQPDFVWMKGRSGATDHGLYDSVRGTTLDLVSNSANAETTQATGLTAFNTDGFGISTLAKLNTAAATYIAWQWKAGGTAVSNTAGTITSQVSANTAAGFSVVTYTGTGANATVGHGLGIAPSFIIIKNTATIAGNWIVYSSKLTAIYYLVLNSTTFSASSVSYFNNTEPTSSLFSVGNAVAINNFSEKIVAYCFAEIAGYSKFGIYTGNGSASGPFVYCGFKPRFIMIKASSTTGDWAMIDTTRSTFNVAGITSSANTAAAEAALLSIDILANGFKIRSATLNNTSAATYIFAAWAENSIKYALAR